MSEAPQLPRHAEFTESGVRSKALLRDTKVLMALGLMPIILMLGQLWAGRPALLAYGYVFQVVICEAAAMLTLPAARAARQGDLNVSLCEVTIRRLRIAFWVLVATPAVQVVLVIASARDRGAGLLIPEPLFWLYPWAFAGSLRHWKSVLENIDAALHQRHKAS